VKLDFPTNHIAKSKQSFGSDKSLKGYLEAHLARLKARLFRPCWLYVPDESAARENSAQTSNAVRVRRKFCYLSSEFGRFPAPTGQAYKVARKAGSFLLQVTCAMMPRPRQSRGQKYTFWRGKAHRRAGISRCLSIEAPGLPVPLNPT